MQKEILSNILAQNKVTSSFAFNQINAENAEFKLTENSASVGFIYRHIGETINMFGMFFGIPTDVQNSTMGEKDKGQGKIIEESKELLNKGYEMLRSIIENTSDEDWLQEIDTPFFGKVPKIRLFSHILFHTSHHAGQISTILANHKGTDNL